MITTVTANLIGEPDNSWSVSTMSYVRVNGERWVQLNVARHFNQNMPGTKSGGNVYRHPNPKCGFIKADADGKLFRTEKEARSFALKRGYLQPFGRNYGKLLMQKLGLEA
jgi:hypothetical protein